MAGEARVAANPRLRSRRELRRGRPGGELLIDAAHNPAGAAALASYLQDIGAEKLPIVFAAMARQGPEEDDRAAGAGRVGVHRHDRAQRAGARRLISWPTRFARCAQYPVEAIASPEAAVARALELSRRAVAGGSIYMVGPLRAKLIAGGATVTARLISST